MGPDQTPYYVVSHLGSYCLLDGHDVTTNAQPDSPVGKTSGSSQQLGIGYSMFYVGYGIYTREQNITNTKHCKTY